MTSYVITRYFPTVVLAFVAGTATAATPIYSTNFESANPLNGWSLQGAGSTPVSSLTSDVSASGNYALKVVDGTWLSPYFAADSAYYYQVTANVFSASGNTGMWGSNVQTHVPYPTTGTWTPVSYAFRGSSFIQAMFGSSSPDATYVDDVTISQVTRSEAKQTLAEYYATLPAYDFKQSVRTHAEDQLPATIAKLRAGQAVNCVMLGDSIVGDTSNSFWETQLDGQYSGQINVTTSIRSSTGCWYYQDPGQLHDYVLQYNPDLVIIGGISHDPAGGPANDTADIASVIDQIRAYNPATEILLLTETSSGNNPFANPLLADPLDPNGTDWRANLYRLAQDKHTGFLDMTEGWADYILASGESYDWFLRDPIHDNARGESVIGRTLATYFAPVPEPTSVALLLPTTFAFLRRRRGRNLRS